MTTQETPTPSTLDPPPLPLQNNTPEPDPIYPPQQGGVVGKDTPQSLVSIVPLLPPPLFNLILS